jgi:2,3-bisphosphoglycerate-independent phosphoglycerate mutase
MEDGDIVIFFNFRADRAREISTTLTSKDFNGFDIVKKLELGSFICMTEYDEKMGLPVAFKKQSLENIFGEVISKNGMKQLRIAKTEKYAHVTFFFNGGSEKAFDGEDRILKPSPRDVATYDLKPEMSAPELTERLLKELKRSYYDLLVVNYANCDMVGHTGVFEAAVKAVETVDVCVGKIFDFIINNGGTIFLTADHGNAEKMLDANNGPHTAHTTDDVRFLVISKDLNKESLELEPGRLADIMPTILTYIGVPVPKERTGINLVKRVMYYEKGK